MGTDASAPPILLCLRSKNIKQSYHKHCYSDNTWLSLNPLSPDIHLQILHTDLYTFRSRISWVNLTKDQGIFVLVIILLILITFSFDSEWVLLRENCCWSPLQWQIQVGGGGAQGAQANSDNAKFFIAKYCGKQNNVKKWNNNLRKYNKTAIIT